MYARVLHVCMYACMYVCMYVCMDGWMDGWMDGCMYACMHACMYACMHVCMYAWECPFNWPGLRKMCHGHFKESLNFRVWVLTGFYGRMMEWFGPLSWFAPRDISH